MSELSELGKDENPEAYRNITGGLELSIDNSPPVKQVSVDLVRAAIRDHLGDSRETLAITYDEVRLPDIIIGLSKWLEEKKIIVDYPIWSGDSWPMTPGHWEIIDILGNEYLFPKDIVIIMKDCALEINTQSRCDEILIELHAPLGKAQGILDSIRASVKNHGVMKGGVATGTKLLERSTTTLDDFFVNPNVLKKIQTHLLNLFDGEREKAFHAAGMPFKRGIILTGVPGTGKTTLAKIIESLNPGITTIWLEHEQLERYMGAAMRLARELAPTILFMEDLDTVAVTREVSVGNTTLGKILYEMDGREKNEGIVFIGTSNRPDDLDPALIRPGRFDVMIELDLPNAQIREALLSKLLGKLSFPLDVTIPQLVPLTESCTQADIEELVRHAVLSLLHAGEEKLQIHHFQKIDKTKGKVGFG